MIKGVGIDLQAVERVEKAIEKDNFVRRVYTPAEQAYLNQKGALRAQSAAGIYAAKEAALKALKTGIGKTALCEAEITHDALGAPEIILHGAAKARLWEMGAQTMHVSITHDGGFAMAVCIAEGSEEAKA